jgi:hypothetical protein
MQPPPKRLVLRVIPQEIEASKSGNQGPPVTSLQAPSLQEAQTQPLLDQEMLSTQQQSTQPDAKPCEPGEGASCLTAKEEKSNVPKQAAPSDLEPSTQQVDKEMTFEDEPHASASPQQQHPESVMPTSPPPSLAEEQEMYRAFYMKMHPIPASKDSVSEKEISFVEPD